MAVFCSAFLVATSFYLVAKSEGRISKAIFFIHRAIFVGIILLRNDPSIYVLLLALPKFIIMSYHSNDLLDCATEFMTGMVLLIFSEGDQFPNDTFWYYG